MSVWIALLRGVNVGGVKVEMARLRTAIAAAGFTDVSTYIASGNLICRSDDTADAATTRIEAAIAETFGRAIPVKVMSREDFKATAGACPFDPAQGKDVHAFFLWSAAHIDDAQYSALRTDTETLTLAGGAAWLHAPDGIGRSKLAEKMHKVLIAENTTARNLNTVRKLVELSFSLD